MAEVAILVRIYPEDPEKVNDLLERIKALNPKDVGLEEIGFGVKAVRAVFIQSDEAGSNLEDDIQKVEGVSNVEVLSVDRL